MRGAFVHLVLMTRNDERNQTFGRRCVFYLLRTTTSDVEHDCAGLASSPRQSMNALIRLQARGAVRRPLACEGQRAAVGDGPSPSQIDRLAQIYLRNYYCELVNGGRRYTLAAAPARSPLDK